MSVRTQVFRSLASSTMAIWMVAIWILFAPTQFGGRASYVIIAGASMEPALHSGDLVVALQSQTYQVGDVVTYTHPQVGPVIHRIINLDGNKFTLQGDNNEWIDAYQPTEANILGKSWMTLPGAAIWLERMRTPVGLALLSLAVGFMLLVTVSRGKDDKVNRSFETTSSQASTVIFSETRQSWIFPLATILLGGMLLGVIAFNTPLIENSITEIPYSHDGTFNYYARGSSSVYDESRIESGDAIFHTMVDKVRVFFDYELSGPMINNVSGSYEIHLEVSEPNGWRRQVSLIPATTFTDGRFTTALMIDLDGILDYIEVLRERTEFNRAAYDVKILPIINIEADIAGQPIHDQFTPNLHFKLDEYQLYLDGTNPFEEVGDPLNPSLSGTVDLIDRVPSTINILGLDILVETTRLIAGIAVAVGLIGLIYVLFPLLRSWQLGESYKIALQHGELILDVGKLPKTTAAKTIDVAEFSDLAKLSQSVDAPILHLTHKNQHTYLLQFKENFYRFNLLEEKDEG
jgi:signal peptidase I